MTLDHIVKLQLKRVNAFQGLIIDADTWQDAHNYHSNQHRIHLLAFHGTGIVQGLNVVSHNPPDLSVTIQPGLAIDPEGNTIIIPQEQHYQIQTRRKGTTYLIIQFREIPTEPYQPPDGGQATRILEAYRIQERDKLPKEPYVELARINFDAAKESIKDAKVPSKPGENEINLNFREEIKKETPAASVVPAPSAARKAPPEVKEVSVPPRETITLGHTVLGSAEKNLHVDGLKNLVKDINQKSNFVVELAENISLDKDIGHYAMIYMAGNSNFELSDEQQEALRGFLQSGGFILGEGCSEGEGQSKGAREFGLAFNKLASKLKSKLETVQRGHTLLSAANIFSVVPPGAEPIGLLLQGGNMIYSGSDYGCAWNGGHQNDSLSRDIIRASFEIGTNIIIYAHMVGAANH